MTSVIFFCEIILDINVVVRTKDKIINIKATIKNIYDKKIFFKDKAKDIPKEKLKAMYKI